MKRQSKTAETVRVRRGLTVLEVLVALVIFAAVSTATMVGLVSGDRVRGRAIRVQRASLLAQNLAEQIRVSAQWNGAGEPTDSMYEESVGGLLFQVERTVLDTTTFPVAGTRLKNREMEILVRLAGQEDTLMHFRMVQGYLE